MEKDFKIGGIGYCLVEVESRYENKTGFFGVDQKELIVDTKFEPLRYVKTFGRVIQIPFAMREFPLTNVPIGWPGYGPIRGKTEDDCHAALYAIGGVYKWKRLSDIEPEVQVGDIIWFNRMILHKLDNLVEEFDRDGVKIFVFRVEYDQIVCIEKEDGPVMIGGKCFIKPVGWNNVLIATYYDYLDPNGNKVERPRDQWIKMPLPPAADRVRGILKHFGKPLKGDKFYIQKEAEVFVRKQMHWNHQGWRYVYKGEDFAIIPQWDIYGEIVEVPDEQPAIKE